MNLWKFSLALLAVVKGAAARPATPSSSSPAASSSAAAPSGPKISVNTNQVITGSYMLNATVESYRGIPFGQAPVNELSFRRPLAYNQSYDGLDATNYGFDCPSTNVFSGSAGLGNTLLSYSNYLDPQIRSGLATILVSGKSGDDCLNLNVYRPANISADAKLPVLVWIYGGAFVFGGSSSYAGEVYVKESMDMNTPVIYVSINYRLGPWGFLGGKEAAADNNTNAGLLDQRLALEWIQDHITEFGGDPSRVTISGESAGAMSCAYQMVLNDGDNSYKGNKLFSGVIMQSGGVLPFQNVTSTKPQQAFDTVVNAVGCDQASDKIACLRTKNSTEITQGTSNISLADAFLGFSPHADGSVLSDNGFNLFRQGKFTKVPYITGNQEDEGTIFASIFSKLSTTDEVVTMFKTFFEDATDNDLQDLLAAYPENPAAGSPFRTGLLSASTPQYKRICAFLCDLLFHAPRRFMLENTPADIGVYSYLSSTGFGTPYLGTFHASDLVWQYALDFGPSKVYKRYWISFANTGSPNNDTALPRWDAYDRASKNLLGVNVATLGIVEDTFREEGITLLKNSTRLRV